MNNAMIEQVAQAIWRQSNRQLRSGETWADAHPLAKDAFRELARAAIEAMRIPTMRMIHAAILDEAQSEEEIWLAMIDAALTDNETCTSATPDTCNRHETGGR